MAVTTASAMIAFLGSVIRPAKEALVDCDSRILGMTRPVKTTKTTYQRIFFVFLKDLALVSCVGEGPICGDPILPIYIRPSRRFCTRSNIFYVHGSEKVFFSGKIS